MGLSHLDNNKSEEDIELLTQAFKLNPYERRVWSVKSSILFKLGRYKEAHKCGLEGLKYI